MHELRTTCVQKQPDPSIYLVVRRRERWAAALPNKLCASSKQVSLPLSAQHITVMERQNYSSRKEGSRTCGQSRALLDLAAAGDADIDARA